MVMTEMEVIKENSRYAIDVALSTIKTGSQLPEAYDSLVKSYRRLALAYLLDEADIEAFAENLLKASDAYISFQTKIKNGLEADPNFYCTSKSLAFYDALCAGNLSMATQIAKLTSQTHFNEIEYEDSFLRLRVFQDIFLKVDVGIIAKRLARWFELTEGRPNYFADVAKSLFENDSEFFMTSFNALVERRSVVMEEYRKLLNYDPVVDNTEGKIFLDGLAILRIAELHGMPTSKEYPMIPEIVRLPIK